jgi:peptide/nickel transport system substrate-binding protein
LLRRYRRAAHLTQEDLAERAKISKDTISALERGVSRAPQRATIELLADALQLSEAERAQLEDAARQLRRNSPAPEDAPLHLVLADEDQVKQPSLPESNPRQKPTPLPARRQRKRVVLILGALLVLLVGTYSGLSYWLHLWPFGKGAPTATAASDYHYIQPTHKGGTIIFSTTSFFELDSHTVASTNPWFANDGREGGLIAALWGSPYAISRTSTFLPDELAEIPTLANGDVSKDSLTVTMRLRHDLRWSDGQPLTADDFVYWLDVLLAPDLRDEIGSTFGYDKIATYSASDAYTLVLRYKQKLASALSFLYYLPLAAPKHAWGGISNRDLINRDKVNLYPEVTSGPFRIESIDPGKSITMVPNNPYYISTTLHRSVLDKLVYRVSPDRDAEVAAYEAGKIDFTEDFIDGDFARFKHMKGEHIFPSTSFTHLEFNLNRPVLQVYEVRKAIEEAIDRCSIIRTVFQDSCDLLRTDTILPPLSHANDPTVKTYSFNPAQARNDMLLAGWNCASKTCIRNGELFPTLTLVTTSGNAVRMQVAKLIQQYLEDLGIPVSLQPYPSGMLFNSYSNGGILATGQYDLSYFTFTFGLDNFENFSGFHSSQIPTDSNPDGGNLEGVNDPNIDSELDEAETTVDLSVQTQLFKSLQHELVARVYVIPLYLSPHITFVSSNIVNEQDNAFSDSLWNVGDWFLIK